MNKAIHTFHNQISGTPRAETLTQLPTDDCNVKSQ